MSTEKRGFALMSRERNREIARKGGRAAQKAGVAHRWDTKSAAEAGRKGGLAPHRVRGGQVARQEKRA